MTTWQRGDNVGAYEIIEEVGSGGMAAVYRAYHARLDREVALKVIHPAFQTDNDFLTRFEREAKIIAKLEHPNIVAVYDFAEHERQPYLVIRYVEGQTLKDLMSERPPTLAEIVRIVGAVADALDYAHGRGVLHRDIKPSNVMMDDDGTPYLTDFGLARLVQSGESSLSAGMMVGTPFYIAPEQASGSHPPSERSDVYALGVMLYEMVVGRRPFDGGSPYATIHQQIYEAPPLPSALNPEVPTAVEMVLLHALEKDPADRFASAGELAAAFREAVKSSGLSELSPERSSVAHPMPSTPYKPKRATPSASGDESVLLLLPEEDSWANLPRDEIARRRIKRRRDEIIGLVAHGVPYLAVNTMIILASMNDGGFRPTLLITPLAWGAGMAAHAIHTYFTQTPATNRLYASFDDEMAEQYGPSWRETLPPDTIQNAWHQRRAHYEEQQGVVIHAAVFLMINLMLWSIWANDLFEGGEAGFAWPLMVTAGWGAGLLAHAIGTYGGMFGGNNQARVDEELARMQGSSAQQSQAAKPKREGTPPVRLTDDGELTDSVVDAWDEAERDQRGR